ncbi:MAG: chemotaxis protein CheW [Ignavibacteriales bacterium]
MEEEKSLINRYIQFKMSSQDFLLDIASMEEVISLDEIIQLPDTPKHIKGVTRFRTQVIPIIDIKERLGLQDNGLNKRAKIMVVRYKEEKVGILIDCLVGVKNSEEINLEARGAPELIELNKIIG